MLPSATQHQWLFEGISGAKSSDAIQLEGGEKVAIGIRFLTKTENGEPWNLKEPMAFRFGFFGRPNAHLRI